jgi:hypothetical protein
MAVAVGQTVIFTAATSGTPGTIRWQIRAHGGATYHNVVGARGTTLRFATVAGQNRYLYRAVFTNSVGQAITDDVELLPF